MGVGHAQHLDVVDVAAFAGDETSVFLAHDACANAFNAHVLVSLPEFSFSAISIEIRRSCIGRCVLNRTVLNRRVLNRRVLRPAKRYSAACATFMRPAASSTDLTML